MEDLYAEHDKALDLLVALKEELRALTVKELLKASSSDKDMRRLLPSLDEAATIARAIGHSITLLKEDITYLELNAQNEKEIESKKEKENENV